MNVNLNETALSFLLESPAGPVGRDLERRAIAATDAARINAQQIMWRTSVPIDAIVGYAVTTDAQGLVATIGVIGQGKISRYLAAKAERESIGGWLVRALQAAA